MPTQHKRLVLARGRCVARYTVQTAAGPKKRKSIYGKRREDVQDALAKALSDWVDGIVYDENTTVGEYLSQRLKTCASAASSPC